MHCPNCDEPILQENEQERSYCSFCTFPIRLLAGRYRFQSRIAEGGFGLVYLAQDTQDEIQPLRAIKILKKNLFDQAGAFDRFQREIKVTAELSKETPHIVHVYPDAGEDPVFGYYYVMEYLEGSSLRELMKTEKLTKERIFSIFQQIFRVLKLVHKKGLAHRDLKPDNIFLTHHQDEEDFVKLLDFGIVKLLSYDSMQLTQGTVGSPDYMAPEQCKGELVDERMDQYALATLLFEVLTGDHPLYDTRENLDVMVKLTAVLNREPRSLRDLKPCLSEELEATIQRALSKEPEKRFSTLEEFEEKILFLLCAGGEQKPNRDYSLSIEVADASYWVGARPEDSIFYANPYLRVFSGTDRRGREIHFNLLIDPGSSKDFEVVKRKVTERIGGLDKLSAVFINHQDPDVCSSLTLLLGRYAPQARILCSENTWRLIQHLNLSRERFLATEKYPRGFQTPTQDILYPIPSPFCHSAGAVMLYDPQTRVLYSGDLFGGLQHTKATGEWADCSDWAGMRAFHQMYMPGQLALKRTIAKIRSLEPSVKVIAPQHGRWLRGKWLRFYMDKLENLKVGLDLLEEQTADKHLAWTVVLQQVLQHCRDLLPPESLQRLRTAEELQESLLWSGDDFFIQRDGNWVVERALHHLTMGLPNSVANLILLEAAEASMKLDLPTPTMQLEEGESLSTAREEELCLLH